ncbi:hypothetical protein CLOM_g20697 [Closterium sp. NIES-68]|nr:hypothetical protein CLOM_g20697 [Closterium sp. NIES-68]GJP82403.1 hypothetical protein CLOP_g12666 [Closterium sp. NIES-67]
MGDSGREPAAGCVQRPASPRIVARPASPLVSARPSSPRVGARIASPRVATRPAPLESDRQEQSLQQPLQSRQQPLQQRLPLQDSFELPLHSPAVIPPGVLVDHYPQNPPLEPEGVSFEDDVAAVRGPGAVGRVRANGGASTNGISSGTSSSRMSGNSAIPHSESPRRSRSRVATSPTRPRSTPQLECFRVLGVPRTASLQEIRVAYRSLCRKWHPDLNKEAGAAAMFVDVNRAYEAAVQAHERASKAKQQRPARRKDDFDEFWDDFLGGGPSVAKGDPRRRRQSVKPGNGGEGERMRDPLTW